MDEKNPGRTLSRFQICRSIFHHFKHLYLPWWAMVGRALGARHVWIPSGTLQTTFPAACSCLNRDVLKYLVAGNSKSANGAAMLISINKDTHFVRTFGHPNLGPNCSLAHKRLLKVEKWFAKIKFLYVCVSPQNLKNLYDHPNRHLW